MPMAHSLVEPRAMFSSPGPDQLKSKTCRNREEITRCTPAAGRLMRQAKFYPAAEWGEAEGMVSLSLSSQWHRRGKVSVKVSGCRIGSGWQLRKYMVAASQEGGGEREKKRKGERELAGRKQRMSQTTESTAQLLCPERPVYCTIFQPLEDLKIYLMVLYSTCTHINKLAIRVLQACNLQTYCVSVCPYRNKKCSCVHT